MYAVLCLVVGLGMFVVGGRMIIRGDESSRTGLKLAGFTVATLGTATLVLAQAFV